jgi:hypothetical protein
MSTPKTEVRKGTITTPPPSPVNEPKKPAANAPNQISKEISRAFGFVLIVKIYNRGSPSQYFEKILYRIIEIVI